MPATTAIKTRDSQRVKPMIFFVKLKNALKDKGMNLKDNSHASWALKLGHQCWMPILYFHHDIWVVKFDIGTSDEFDVGLGDLMLCIPFHFQRLLDVIKELPLDSQLEVDLLTLSWQHKLLDRARIVDISPLALGRYPGFCQHSFIRAYFHVCMNQLKSFLAFRFA